MNEFDRKAREWDKNPQRKLMARTVAENIRNRIPLSHHMRSFEYGCGTGLLSFALQPFLGYMLLADSSGEMISVTREKITRRGLKNMKAVRTDLTLNSPPDDTFDLIYSQMTLHHVPDIPQILSVFSGMFRKPGYLCIADLDSEDGSFHGEGFRGHNGFDRRELSRMAETAGFSDIKVSTVFQMSRESEDGEVREYPVFLLTAVYR
ncbi:MAG: class I SAM-dependent methyltransferase [Chitinispirillaceae bacterium]